MSGGKIPAARRIFISVSIAFTPYRKKLVTNGSKIE
jgi:hypothetical protein